MRKIGRVYKAWPGSCFNCKCQFAIEIFLNEKHVPVRCFAFYVKSSKKIIGYLAPAQDWDHFSFEFRTAQR